MEVVSNTSPILNLAAIGKEDLLTQLFSTITAPKMVANEIQKLRRSNPRFISADLGKVANFVSVSNRSQVTVLSSHLDPGEAEAIALAFGRKADLLLIDERAATLIAQRLGLKTLGLLGVLILAKRRGYIEKICPIIEQLESKAGFWIGASLRKKVLNLVSE